MGLRITDGMMINRVNLNIQRSLGRFMNMQTQMSSGRRINKPSDDPVGTQRDLNYRAQIDKIAQYQRNVEVASNWQRTYDSILADAKDLLTSAKEQAISMSNSTYDAAARAAAAVEIRSIFDRLLALGNSELEGKSIFAGYKTDVTPFQQSAAGVVYRGNDGVIELEAEANLMTTTNLVGSNVFLRQLQVLGADSDLNPAVTGNTLLADLNGGSGVDLTTGATPGTIAITDLNLGITSLIDFNAAPAATTVQDVINRINDQLAADGITDTVAKLGPSHNNLMLEANPSGIITANTSLAVLNESRGVDLGSGVIILRDGVNPDIQMDLTGSSTIGDIIAKFNAQAPAGVTMQIDPVGNKGLQIVDANPIPLGLEVLEAGTTSSTAADLGILGSIAPVLTGTDLNPTVQFKIEETSGRTAQDLGLLGEFTGTYLGQDLNPRLVATASIGDLINGAGLSRGAIALRQGNMVRTVNLANPAIITVQDLLDAINNSGLNITASINAAGTGIQVVNNRTDLSFSIVDSGNSSDQSRQLGVYGGSDLMASLLVLAEALENNDEEGVRTAVGTMGKAIDHALTVRADVGARWSQLETIDARHVDNNLAFTKLLSDTEDADVTEMTMQLSTYENHYQVALMAAAKIIQPSLIDFLD